MKKLMSAMILFILLCLINSPLALTAANDSLLLWSNGVLPALLPFFIASQVLYYAGGAKWFSRLLAPLMRAFSLPAAGGFALTMSLLCGYPTGSRMCALLYEEKQISGEECGQLSILCHTCGPVFLSGTLATVLLGQPSLALPLISISVCAAFLTALLLRPQNTASSPLQPHKSSLSTARAGKLFGDAVSSGIQSILMICGYMVFFGIVIQFVLYYGSPLLALLPDSWRGEVTALVAGSIEMTRGLALLSGSSSPLRLPLICMIVSFSGLCIIMQCQSLLPSAYSNTGRFIFARLLSAGLAFLLCLLYENTVLAVPIVLTVLLCAGSWCYQTVHKKLAKYTTNDPHAHSHWNNI